MVASDAPLLKPIYMAVPKHAAHAAAAKLWINYLMTREAQDVIYAARLMDNHRLPVPDTAADIERLHAGATRFYEGDLEFFLRNHEAQFEPLRADLIRLQEILGHCRRRRRMTATEPRSPAGDPTVDPTAFAHTGPGTLAGRYLRRFWQPVALAAELPLGHAQPIRMMSEDFTLYRGEDGAPHVVAPRCAHRARSLAPAGWRATACAASTTAGSTTPPASASRCPPRTQSFPPKVRIASYPTEEYLG